MIAPAMPLRFLHLADLHLDTAFGGRQAATRKRLQTATREAFSAAIDLALAENLDALLVAGDGFDEERLDFGTELWLAREVKRLACGGVDLVWIAGNHDPGAAGGRLARMALDQSALPNESSWTKRVHVIRGKRPTTVELYGPDGLLRGKIIGAGHPTSKETDNLAARFPRQDTSEVPVVGLLHTQVHAAAGSAEHASYAPSTQADFRAAGYDYWALGHVHLRGQPFADLPAWYPGNLCGRNPKECGPKGGLLVELECGITPQPTFVPLAPTRWEQIQVPNLGLCSSPAMLMEAFMQAIRLEQDRAGSDELFLRLIPSGPCPLAAELENQPSRTALEAELRDATGLLEVQLRPKDLAVPRNLDELRSHPSALAEALTLAEHLEAHPEEIDPELLQGLASLRGLDASPDAHRKQVQSIVQGLPEMLLQRALQGPLKDMGS